MKRREFITLLGGATALWPAMASTQQAPLRPLIGVLSPLSAMAAARNIAAFRSGLRDLGHLEGRNVTLALRYGDGAPERMPMLARELVALNPDVLFAGALSGAQSAHDATRTIPIVVATPENPVVSGFAKSIAHPGGNVTGTWSLGDDALIGKRLDFLKLAVPGVARVGALVNPDDVTDGALIPKLPAAGRDLGLTVEIIEVRNASNLDEIAGVAMRANIQGLFVGQSPFLNSIRPQIAAMAMRLRLPSIYFFRESTDAGGLMPYGPSLPNIYRQSARLVDKILKGTKPADLPFELPTRYELIVNLKTAKTIGLAISDSFLLLADEVIE